MNSWLRVLACGVVVLMTTGCASFGDLSKVKRAPWPVEGTKEKKSVSLQYGVNFTIQPLNQHKRYYVPLGPWAPPEVLKAFQESGIFSEVKTVVNPGEKPADLQVDIKVLEQSLEVPSGGAWVGLTLGLGIGKVREHLLVAKARFKDSSGKVLGYVEVPIEGSEYWGLLALFGIPFRDASWDGAKPEIYRAVLIEARQKGII